MAKGCGQSLGAMSILQRTSAPKQLIGRVRRCEACLASTALASVASWIVSLLCPSITSYGIRRSTKRGAHADMDRNAAEPNRSPVSAPSPRARYRTFALLPRRFAVHSTEPTGAVDDNQGIELVRIQREQQACFRRLRGTMHPMKNAHHDHHHNLEAHRTHERLFDRSGDVLRNVSRCLLLIPVRV